MSRSLLLLTALCTTLCTQAQEALGTLTGTTSQQWTVVGTSAAEPCAAGAAMYTFQAQPAQVVVKECDGGAWKSSTQPVTSWNTGGKSGIAFGGAKYEVKSLPATAPACKGNATCVRLTTVPDGKTDATRSIYLTH